MTHVIEVNKDVFFALSNGQEVSLTRNEAKEYAATFPVKDDFIKIRYDNIDYVGVMTARIDRPKDDGNLLINFRFKMNH